MKIYIDVTVLTLATFITGIQRVTREICIGLLRYSYPGIILIHYNAAKNSYYRIDPNRFLEYYTEGKGIKEKMITSERIKYSEINADSIFFDLDAAWMSRMKRSYLLPRIKRNGAVIVAFIYDIISVTHPQYCLERGVYNFMDYLGAHLLYADQMIVNARATRDEIQKLTEKLGCRMPKCSVIPLGADFHTSAPNGRGHIPEELAVRNRPYLLMVGTIEPRKNHKLLLKAYDQKLKHAGYDIVFAGSMGWKSEKFQKQLQSHPDYGCGVFHFEGLDDDTINALYRNAKFLIFASYTEGFGLPVVESICRGLPVIAADTPVIRETGEDYCVWFHQDSIEELCARVKEYGEKNAYQALKGKMSSFQVTGWDHTVREVYEVLNEVIKGRGDHSQL